MKVGLCYSENNILNKNKLLHIYGSFSWIRAKFEESRFLSREETQRRQLYDKSKTKIILLCWIIKRSLKVIHELRELWNFHHYENYESETSDVKPKQLFEAVDFNVYYEAFLCICCKIYIIFLLENFSQNLLLKNYTI